MKKKWLSVVCCLPLICGCSALSIAPTANSRSSNSSVGRSKRAFSATNTACCMKRFTTRNLWDRGMPSTRSSGSRIRCSWLRSRATRNACTQAAASKIDRDRAIPFRIGSFRAVPHQNRSFRKDGEKGPDFRHVAHPRGNTQRGQDHVGVPELPPGKRNKKGCPENAGEALFRAFYLQSP